MEWIAVAFDIHSGQQLTAPPSARSREEAKKIATDYFGPSAAVSRKHRGVEWDLACISKTEN
jgi:hypothetical protein